MINFLGGQTKGGNQRWLLWLSVLAGVLTFSLLNLLLMLLLPGVSAGGGRRAAANPTRAMMLINGLAAVLAIVITPYLLRIFDNMQQRVTRQNNELRSLHAIDTTISAELNLETILTVAVRELTLAVDGEFGAMWLFDEGGQKSPLAASFYNIPPLVQTLMRERFGEGASGFVARTGAPVRRQDLERTWNTDRVASTLKARNTVAIPIRWQDRVLGVFTVGNRGGALAVGDGFTAEDEELLVAISTTIGVAIQNARLYAETQRRGEMLRALVSRTGEAIEASSDMPRLMQILADEAARILNTPRIAVYVHDGLKEQFVPLAAHDELTDDNAPSLPQFFDQPIPTDLVRQSLGEVADAGREGAPLRALDNVSQALGLPPGQVAFLDGPGAVFVLRARDRRGIGLLCLRERGPRPLSSEIAAFARALAAQASVALENAQLGEQLRAAADRDRNIAETFQRSMLPNVPPRVGGFEFAHKYQAALAESDLGGDFFDLFLLDKDRVGIVMADVSGKGLNAAVQTAMVKYTLRGFALENADAPGKALECVNDVLCSGMSNYEGFVTLFYGVLHTQTGELVCVNAGHEPPLMRSDAGPSVGTVDSGDGMALGCLGGVPYEEKRIQMQPGDRLLLHTDGLTEARSPSGEFLTQEGVKQFLLAQTGQADDDVENIYEEARAYAGDALRDDVAMLLLYRMPLVSASTP